MHARLGHQASRAAKKYPSAKQAVVAPPSRHSQQAPSASPASHPCLPSSHGCEAISTFTCSGTTFYEINSALPLKHSRNQSGPRCISISRPRQSSTTEEDGRPPRSGGAEACSPERSAGHRDRRATHIATTRFRVSAAAIDAKRSSLYLLAPLPVVEPPRERHAATAAAASGCQLIQGRGASGGGGAGNNCTVVATSLRAATAPPGQSHVTPATDRTCSCCHFWCF